MIGCVALVCCVVLSYFARVVTNSALSIGVYGDVMRVKILFNKKENALVQMSDGTQAQLGKRCVYLPSLFSILLTFSS